MPATYKRFYKYIAGSVLSLFIFSYLSAATIGWDHDCSNATGFFVYLSDEEIDNPQRQVIVDCPATQATVYMPGWYSVTAYNDYGESAQSNRIEIAQYYYNAIKIEYNANGQVAYRGEHTTYNAATSDENWVVKKYYYDAQGRLIDIKIRVMAWDDRATGW